MILVSLDHIAPSPFSVSVIYLFAPCQTLLETLDTYSTLRCFDVIIMHRIEIVKL